MEDLSISSLLGKTLKSVIVTENKEEILFITTEEDEYKLWHSQDCCESVSVEEVVGDLNDIVGAPILQAEESSNQDGNYHGESATWTFYKLATIKGSVTIRWLGTSNGYYSESVDFAKVA